MPTIMDTESPPRSWLDEWVSTTRSKEDLRRMINEQQNRLDAYVREIDALKKERGEILRWQVEASFQDMLNRGIIERYKAALLETEKCGGQPADIARQALRGHDA